MGLINWQLNGIYLTSLFAKWDSLLVLIIGAHYLQNGAN